MIPHDFIQTLLARLDIVDVVERSVPLKKAGSNYVACCPFHNEKTPSFTVSQVKQFYHCFGCGAHGSAISFAMEYAGISFVEAVKELASGAGMAVPEQAAREAIAPNEGEARDLSAVLAKALDYYREQLKSSQAAIDYLKERGLSGQIAGRFGLGYAPGGWQNLATVFPEYDDKALLEAGLVIDAESGRRYDRFRDRIMFPILNSRGAVIAFGGRVLGAGEPKYLNSPETPLFEKGRELYGLSQARVAIRAQETVLVVEGYMDVVALAQHGFANAVATLGTATTPVHVQKLLRLADNLIFCFDGDAAGGRAAWRALEVCLPHLVDGKDVRFLFLPDGEDPDSFVRGQGQGAFSDLSRQAIPLSTYLIQELTRGVDLGSEEGRARLLQVGKGLLTQITAPTLSWLLRKRFAELVGVAREEVDSLFGIKPRAREKTPARVARKPLSLETQLIKCLLFRPELAQKHPLPIAFDSQREMQTLISLVVFLKERPETTYLGSILEHFRGTGHEAILEQQGIAVIRDLAGFTDTMIEEEYLGGLGQLAQKARHGQIELLTRKAKSQGLTAEEKRTYQALLATRLN